MASSSARNKAVPLSPEISSVFDLLHDAPLMAGEHVADYEALRASVLWEINPSTLIEQIGARELLSLMWDERRLRRLRDAFINGNLEYGIKSKLDKLVEHDDASLDEAERLDISSYSYSSKLTHHYLAKDAHAIAEVMRLFAEAHISMDEIVSQVFVRHIKTMQDFDQLISNAVQHRNRLISDLERRKDQRQRLVDKMDAILVE
jgi:hypothetical protein